VMSRGKVWYNIAEVIAVSAKVDRILRDVESLSQKELQVLLERMADRFDALGWLKLAEPAFSDWDNPEDEAYDRL